MDITKFEKIALFSVGAAAAWKALLWSLGATVDSSDPKISALRVGFAALSFVAFDLVIGAVVLRGWSVSGAAALLIAAGVNAAIGLDVAHGWHLAELHAAPAATLAAFALHLMWSRRSGAAAAQAAAQEAQTSITQAVQVNVQTGLPTRHAVAAALASELRSGAALEDLARDTGWNAATITRMIAASGE